MSLLSINIVGAGSIGHLLTAYLSSTPASITLYAKQPSKKQTYQLTSPTEKIQYLVEKKTLNQWQAADFIIICVKATALEDLCMQLRKIANKQTPIVLMMNGMGLIEIAKKHLPTTLIYQASTTHGALLVNNQLHHTGQGETLIGKIFDDSLETQGAISPLIKLLNKAFTKTTWNEDHRQSLFKKLLINAILNPLTAIYNVNNGQLIENIEINQRAKKLTQELQPLIHYYLSHTNWLSIFKLVENIANKTNTNSSSMRQDILMGRKTEIDFITGYLLMLAKNHGIKLANHQQLFSQIKKLESTSNLKP